ncbi:hypothetical protein Tco_0939033 [Tanacetum coccineum]|uniref:Uncharacterized protein n=1 Tax=Tanacetum coccineum TaxID=301880 RepID=A0ABQ5DKN7_9ASTR
MANSQTLLFQELSRAAESNDVRDQFSVLFQREVNEDSRRMENYLLESTEIMRQMQLDDMEKASRLMLMARELQIKVHEKNNFIVRLRALRLD